MYWAWGAHGIDQTHEDNEPNPTLAKRPWRKPPAIQPPMLCSCCGRECRTYHAVMEGKLLCMGCLARSWDEKS